MFQRRRRHWLSAPGEMHLIIQGDYDPINDDFASFLKTYEGNGGKMVAELVQALPIGQDEPAAH